MLIPPGETTLPLIRSLADCADFRKTVQPYLPQLYHLPSTVAAHISDPTALQHVYMATNPVVSALAFALATMPLFVVVSEFNRNWSQVDRAWSTLPTLFIAHFAVWGRLHGLPTQKVDHALAVFVVWSLRLTYNYWRKGGYQIGSEDYRWKIVKDSVGAVPFFLLNVVFISTLQILTLLAIATPAYVLLLTSRINPVMTTADRLFARLPLALVALEWFADGQQWRYQTAKQHYQQTARVPDGWTPAQMDRGFNTTGLWRYSRHPNFAAEQAVWLALYLWACWTTRDDSHGGSVPSVWWNWTVVGALGYSAIFQASTPLTEWISGRKYPEYRIYRQRVGRFVPNVTGKGWDEEEMRTLGAEVVEEAVREKAKTRKKK